MKFTPSGGEVSVGISCQMFNPSDTYSAVVDVRVESNLRTYMYLVRILALLLLAAGGGELGGHLAGGSNGHWGRPFRGGAECHLRRVHAIQQEQVARRR